MKLTTLTFCLIMSQCLFSQDFLMDSIKAIQGRNDAASGEAICTPGFWSAERRGGKITFEQICTMKSNTEFKISDEKPGVNRAILVVDYLRDGEKRDEIYLFAVMNDGQWLMDGFTEVNALIQPFLDGKCSGHFNPTDLPTDSELEKIALEMLIFKENPDGLRTYLEKNVASDTKYSSIVSQFTNRDSYTDVIFSSAGYSEEFEKGYIRFIQPKEKSPQRGNITLYMKRTENGKYKISSYAFSPPKARSFFK